MKKFTSNKRAYAIYRSGIAIDRMIAVSTPAGKTQAAKWATAWGVAAGALIPRNFRIRKQRPHSGVKGTNYVVDQDSGRVGTISSVPNSD